MHSSAKIQSPPLSVFLFVRVIYHKQEVRFLLYLHVRLSPDNHNPNPLDKNWPFTVINDQDWQLGKCPFKTIQLSKVYKYLCHRSCSCLRRSRQTASSSDNDGEQRYLLQHRRVTPWPNNTWLNLQAECIVPQILIIRPYLLKSIVHVIRFITNIKYTFCCVY